MTKIDIISGFLGAGKTTLIKKLLKEAFSGQKIVLIENEFGEIGIDGGFLKDAGVQITEMNSGCICCSLVGDFGAALKQVVETYAPDRIIIEPSGVGKLSDVIAAVVRAAENNLPIELNNFVTVADANKCKMYMKNFGEFYNNQIESANTIILSRTQGMNEEKLKAAVELIQEKNSKVKIITTPWDELTGEQILAVMEQGQSLTEELMKEAVEAARLHELEHHHHDDDEDEEEHEHHHHHDDEDEEEHEHHHHHDDEDEEEHEHHHHHDDEDEEEHEHHHHHDDEDEHEHHHDGHCSCGHHHHHHHADEVFTSWGKETPKKFSREELEKILKALSETNDYGIILRSKGMLPTASGEWLYFDLVPGEYEIRTGAPEYTGRFCVIGSELKEDKLTELFGL